MRPQPHRAAFFQLSRCALVALALVAPSRSECQAQSTSAAQLNFNVWQSTPRSPVAERPSVPNITNAVAERPSVQSSSSEVRQANFQSPDAQLPPLPGAGPAPLPDIGLPNANFNSAATGSLGDAVLPPPTAPLPGAFNQFSNPGGAMAPTQVQQAGGTGLRDVAHPSQLPPLNNSQLNNAQPGYRPTSFQNGVVPPGYGQMPQSQYPQAQYGQVNPYANGQAVLPPGAMRSANGAQPMPGQAGQTVVGPQDPRFVSPPVRTGNYATVPYRVPLRTVSYQTGPGGIVAQLPSQTVAPLPVQQPLTVATQAQPGTLASTSSMPQFQPTVGAQLTGYQTGYQSGYQAGQVCQQGVPGVVPGAVVPPTLPPNLTPQLYSPDNAGFKPLFSLGQENYNVLLGRGIIGQPTAYVPGQPVRNFMRYIFP